MFTRLAVGDSHCCAVRDDGSIACMGYDFYAQSSEPSADEVAPLDFDAFGSTNCFIRSDRSVHCHGDDTAGIVTGADSTFAGTGVLLAHVAVGEQHACALTSDGLPECWGSNAAGRQNEIPSDTQFLAIEAGARHTCGLTSTGMVKCWGNHSLGQLDGSGGLLGGHVRLEVGGNFGCALSGEGAVHCFGQDASGVVSEAELLDGPQRTLR